MGPFARAGYRRLPPLRLVAAAALFALLISAPAAFPRRTGLPHAFDLAATQADAMGWKLDPKWQYQLDNGGKPPSAEKLCDGIGETVSGPYDADLGDPPCSSDWTG